MSTTLSDFKVLNPVELKATWEKLSPITFDRYIAPGYEHDILITTYFLCISSYLDNWLRWPIKPKFGSTRIWLFATVRDKSLAHNNPVLSEIARAAERVKERINEDHQLGFIVVVRKSVLWIEFPEREDRVKSKKQLREHIIQAFLEELGLLIQ